MALLPVQTAAGIFQFKNAAKRLKLNLSKHQLQFRALLSQPRQPLGVRLQPLVAPGELIQNNPPQHHGVRSVQLQSQLKALPLLHQDGAPSRQHQQHGQRQLQLQLRLQVHHHRLLGAPKHLQRQLQPIVGMPLPPRHRVGAANHNRKQLQPALPINGANRQPGVSLKCHKLLHRPSHQLQSLLQK